MKIYYCKSKHRRLVYLSTSLLFLLSVHHVQSRLAFNAKDKYRDLENDNQNNQEAMNHINNQKYDNNDLFCENIYFIDIEPDPNNTDFQPTTEVRCIVSETDALSKVTSKKIYKLEGLPSGLGIHDTNDLKDGNAGILVKKGSQYKGDDLIISLPSSVDLNVPKITHSHRLLPTAPLPYIGDKKVLVIRAIGSLPGEEPDADALTISKRVFGGDDDNLNLKDGYAACSYNQLVIEKASGSDEIVEGVLEVKLDISTTDQTGHVLEDAIVAAAKAKLGTNHELEHLYDFVMICLPPKTRVSTAYAYLHWKRSVFNNNWCLSPSTQMHEVAHNIGLHHSNENNQAYNDQSCLMGFSYVDNHESPKMCFNGAKSWQLGWYREKSTSIDLDPSNQQTFWTGRLVGVSDYPDALPNDDVVVAEIVTNDDLAMNTDNYYLLYNRKDGINSQVTEFGDLVTITKGHFRSTSSSSTERSDSEHISHLSVGETYIINDFKGSGVGLIVKFCEVVSDASSPPPHAKVSIYLSTGTDRCSTVGETQPETLSPTVTPDSTTPPPTTSCPIEEFEFIFQLQTDDHPEETSWEILSHGMTVAKSKPSLEASTNYEHSLCLTDGCYELRLHDTWSDGICCEYGEGWYRGYIYDKVKNDPIFKGDQFGDVFVQQFCGSSSSASQNSPAEATPSAAPSPLSIEECSSEEFLLKVILMTDNYPEETSFQISDEDGNTILEQNGPFTDHTRHVFNECFVPGCYTFEINDSWGDGICCSYNQGNFEVKIFDTVVVEGEEFSLSYLKSFCGCPFGEKYFELSITPDPFPEETSWEVKDSMNNVVLSGTSEGHTRCIPHDSYVLYVYDSYNDGMCCQYGNGSFTLSYDNKEIVSGGEFASVFTQSFGKTSTIASAAIPSPVIADFSYDKDEKSKGIFSCLLKRVFELFP